MPRENLNDLLAFLAVARERGFTRVLAALRCGFAPGVGSGSV
jgi:DNA-binding transcriptional LysR family regulator